MCYVVISKIVLLFEFGDPTRGSDTVPATSESFFSKLTQIEVVVNPKLFNVTTKRKHVSQEFIHSNTHFIRKAAILCPG